MERIVINSRPQDVTDFLSMEDSIYKNIIYNRDFSSRVFTESDVLKTDDGKIYYALSLYSIKKGKKYYTKLKSKKGFTVDENGKLKIWFGSDIVSNPHFNYALKALKIDWFTNEGDRLWHFMTKTLFEKVITGKITNPIDFISGYLKLSRIKASPKLVYDVCRSKGLSKMELLRGAYSAKDVNHYLEYLMDTGSNKSNHITDMITQSRVLDRKIDFRWSVKRMDEEHTAWTKDIMEAEVTSIPDLPVSVNVYDTVSPYVPEWLEPLDTQKKVFMEGMIMQHCVYTNYWNTIKDGLFLSYHLKYKNEEATLGLYVERSCRDKIKFSQLYGKRNSAVSEELRSAVVNVLSVINLGIDAVTLPGSVNEEKHYLPF